MKAAANGDCTDRWSWRPAAKDHCSVTCRGRQSFVERQAKERVEFQADLYASCLLMSRKLVMHAWRERFGNDHPRVLRRKDRIVVPGDTEDEIVTAFLRRP
jgi:hypothetical protein